ncbi:hypothetical protein A1Q2_05844 [Trichosporon asahii var. asahii CBS 8904]|uniref:Magnesium transporter n=1 Tax=Trichosporon asahii var. asahii (strain CBS 8904) TaxID=1220162 RepID=K1V795_TRIAC|nr:hypothetical protein A1Q2_05844 [Trichosporon asahii var. asahii CBS 8904]
MPDSESLPLVVCATNAHALAVWLASRLASFGNARVLSHPPTHSRTEFAPRLINAAGFLALLGVGLTGNMYYLIQYGREPGSGRVIGPGVDVTARAFSFVLQVSKRTFQTIHHEQSRRPVLLVHTAHVAGDRRAAPVPPGPQPVPVSQLGTAQSHGTGHVSFRQSFGTSTGRPAAVDYTDSPLGTPPLHRQGTHNTHDDSGFGFSVSSGDSDMLRRPRRRSSLTGPKYKWLSNNTGDEPGVDVRSERDEEMYKHLRGKANVTVSCPTFVPETDRQVVDYSPDAEAEDSNVRIDISGERFEHWLESDEGERPMVDGKPVGVRWTDSSLHPLAVEDALRSESSPRSKLDFYRNHLYLQILVQHIYDPDEETFEAEVDGVDNGTIGDQDGMEAAAKRARRWWQRRSNSGQIRLPEGADNVFEPSIPESEHTKKTSAPNDKAKHRFVIDQLSASYMVPIRRDILSVFMLRDGTVISVSKTPVMEVLEPIYERLEDEHSLLRRSGDPSMLIHALLDVAVDLSVEITQAFEAEILKAESNVLVQADLDLVRHLHIVQAQITRFRRSLTTLLHVCYVLRDQDTIRTLAVGNLSKKNGEPGLQVPNVPVGTAGYAPSAGSSLHGSPHHNNVSGPGGQSALNTSGMDPSRRHAGGDFGGAGGGFGGGAGIYQPTPMPAGYAMPGVPGMTAGTGVMPTPNGTPPPGSAIGSAGYISPNARVYMNDVIDHLEVSYRCNTGEADRQMVASSSDQFVATCDHLTDYSFNVLSFYTNNSMERLSIVTVVFLPLTFIASYYGMNFEDFPTLDNPDSYFWKVAAPCTVSFFVIFSFGYLKQAISTLLRRFAKYRQEQQIHHHHAMTARQRRRNKGRLM